MLSNCRLVGRLVLVRAPPPQRASSEVVRNLSSSSLTPTVDKMREIFREYKRNNFPDEMPSRVWKEILVTSDEDKDGFISVEEIQHTLKNIGASDKVSREEILLLMKELGSEQDDRVEVEVLKGLLHDKRGLGHAKAEGQQS